MKQMQADAEIKLESKSKNAAKGGKYKRFVKRPMDFFLSLSAIIVLSPVLLTTTALVKIKLGSPVLFRQKRPGLNGKIFTIYKFRTMAEIKDEHGEPLPDRVRLTGFGQLLRSTSLDELPELFNVVCGKMALVGPRPLLVQYLPLYNEQQNRRHEARPGLTGLAQVNGRNSLTWEEKFNHDVDYIENVSFIGDLKIIFSTVIKVAQHKGINNENTATSEYFMGSENIPIIG